MLLSKEVILTSRVVQSPGNLVSDMDGEKVMLNIENGKYYNLGELGGNIWGLMESEIKIDILIANLLAVYEVEPNECEQQVLSFVNTLYKEGLVQIVE
ncbi:MAG: hypothetical protein K0S25_1453 [Bacillus sp. (in: firmicutes)]|jgi:hypothetical protein|nr:hypothetical protein [Bacillus sp. (in: firmicutes)]